MAKWQLCENGHWYGSVEADTAEEALDEARSNVDRDNYDAYGRENETVWIEIGVRCKATDHTEYETVECPPPEPTCSGDEHEWTAPHAVVGGLKENPGVFGHGGGVIIQEVCAHCGLQRTTDTWAQNGAIQGLTSVMYHEKEPT